MCFIYIYIYIYIYICYGIAEGFRFMPLSLVRLRTFRLSNIEACVNVGARGRMEVSLRCHNSPRRNMVRVTSLTGSARRFVLEFEERQSRELDLKREGSTFGAPKHEANVRPMGVTRVGGGNE